MEGLKTYFHVDMDAFFVSGEELLDPSLKGKAVVVGEQTGTGYSAYAPDPPGLGVTGASIEEVRELISRGVAIYIHDCSRTGRPSRNRAPLLSTSRSSLSRSFDPGEFSQAHQQKRFAFERR
jgi:predicted RNase H-like HicB family nuclease